MGALGPTLTSAPTATQAHWPLSRVTPQLSSRHPPKATKNASQLCRRGAASIDVATAANAAIAGWTAKLCDAEARLLLKRWLRACSSGWCSHQTGVQRLRYSSVKGHPSAPAAGQPASRAPACRRRNRLLHHLCSGPAEKKRSCPCSCRWMLWHRRSPGISNDARLPSPPPQQQQQQQRVEWSTAIDAAGAAGLVKAADPDSQHSAAGWDSSARVQQSGAGPGGGLGRKGQGLVGGIELRGAWASAAWRNSRRWRAHGAN